MSELRAHYDRMKPQLEAALNSSNNVLSTDSNASKLPKKLTINSIETPSLVTLFVGASRSSTMIAGFDLDGTLVRTKSGAGIS